MLKIKIKTGNSAFEPVPERELVRILKQCVSYLEMMADFSEEKYDFALMDVNGNAVGEMEVSVKK